MTNQEIAFESLFWKFFAMERDTPDLQQALTSFCSTFSQTPDSVRARIKARGLTLLVG